MIKAFDTRATYKAAGNPVQEVIKTFINSNWGKTIQGAFPHENKLIDKKDFDKFVCDHFNFIAKNGVRIIGGRFLVKLNKETSNDWSYPHVGALILSYARRMLFQVSTLAEDNEINISYVDTDSVFIEADKVEQLDELYLKKFGRKLVGSGLGQMKRDFESDLGKVVHASNSIFLAKKSYCNKLILEDSREDYRLKLVGITHEAIIEKCEDYSVNAFELYEELF